MNLAGMNMYTGPEGYLRLSTNTAPAPKCQLKLTFGSAVVTVDCARKVDAGRKLTEFRSLGQMVNLATGEVLLASNLTKAEIIVVNTEL